jgi:hypothetical protein
MGEIRNAQRTLVGRPERADHLKDLGVDGRIILEWILEKQVEKFWTRLLWLMIMTSIGAYESCNELRVT